MRRIHFWVTKEDETRNLGLPCLKDFYLWGEDIIPIDVLKEKLIDDSDFYFFI